MKGDDKTDKEKNWKTDNLPPNISALLVLELVKFMSE